MPFLFGLGVDRGHKHSGGARNRQIAAARRRYLEWWGALLWLGAELRSLGILTSIEITQAMPPMTPWR